MKLVYHGDIQVKFCIYENKQIIRPGNRSLWQGIKLSWSDFEFTMRRIK